MKKFCRSSAQLDAWSVLVHITMVALLGGVPPERDLFVGQQVRQAVKMLSDQRTLQISNSSETRGHVNRVSYLFVIGVSS